MVGVWISPYGTAPQHADVPSVRWGCEIARLPGGQETHRQSIVSPAEVSGFGWRKSLAKQAETAKLSELRPRTPPSISQGIGISFQHPRKSVAQKTVHRIFQCDFAKIPPACWGVMNPRQETAGQAFHDTRIALLAYKSQYPNPRTVPGIKCQLSI